MVKSEKQKIIKWIGLDVIVFFILIIIKLLMPNNMFFPPLGLIIGLGIILIVLIPFAVKADILR